MVGLDPNFSPTRRPGQHSLEADLELRRRGEKLRSYERATRGLDRHCDRRWDPPFSGVPLALRLRWSPLRRAPVSDPRIFPDRRSGGRSASSGRVARVDGQEGGPEVAKAPQKSSGSPKFFVGEGEQSTPLSDIAFQIAACPQEECKEIFLAANFDKRIDDCSHPQDDESNPQHYSNRVYKLVHLLLRFRSYLLDSTDAIIRHPSESGHCHKSANGSAPMSVRSRIRRIRLP